MKSGLHCHCVSGTCDRQPARLPAAHLGDREHPRERQEAPVHPCQSAAAFKLHGGTAVFLTQGSCPSLVGEFDPCWAVWIQQAESVDQQEHFMNLISNGQRGRMDDQRCSLDPSRSAPCTPNNSRKVDVSSAGVTCLCSFSSLAYSLGFSFYFQEVWNVWLHFLVFLLDWMSRF